jgi:hypothetical protein
VVTKTVTETRPATVSTPARTSKPSSASSTAAAARFAATALAANAEQAALTVGDAVFGPAELAAAGVMSAAPAASATVTPPVARSHVVAGHATGDYAVAYTNGTFHHPSQIVMTISASPSQSGSVDWNVVCFEDGGGVGRDQGHQTLSLPTTKTLSLPAPSTECIVSANVQLSKTGSVTISISG